MNGPQLTTGISGFDNALKGLIPGDNIVFQVDGIDDYRPFVTAYGNGAARAAQKLIYFRFAKHEPLLSPDQADEIHELHPEEGFEQFILEIHRVIETNGHGGYYVFDCLTDLAVDWYSDRMLGNFFMLTCPYLYDVEAIAYFALLRNYHSSHATTTIAETTQILLDVYRHRGKLYLYPIKVQQRHSPTMYVLHAWEGEEFVPVTESYTIAEILTATPWSGSETARSQLGVWNRTFLQAEKIIDPAHEGECSLEQAEELVHRLLRMLVSRDDRVLKLARQYLHLPDVLLIWRRMIGTGLIGGKSVGMLLARAILTTANERWGELLEAHDSFYIGSDVFYTYLVRSGCWWIRQKQKNPQSFLEGAEEARRRILTGSFPDEIRKEFSDMLDHFGQSPIIVRSSSLLEDAFGNAFAGKYESVFCANQGSRDKRLEDFMSAIRTIYASTMSEKALRYRAQRGMLGKDEQMSLLVQRVSGSLCGNLFYPQVAGVGFSFNPYVWCEQIDPRAGMLRLVFGLGTRAVDRADDDYTRIVSLSAPDRRPESTFDQVRRYTQRRIDTLDLAANRLSPFDFREIVKQSPKLDINMFASRDEDLEERAAGTGTTNIFPWILTFDQLLAGTPFVQDMREMLHILDEAYGTPVDTEFTVNFVDRNTYKINLLQCRPLQVISGGTVADLQSNIRRDRVIMEAHGAVIGQSRQINIDRLVLVVPAVYGRMKISDRYSVARLIGRIMHMEGPNAANRTLLLGPGRWGTTTPSLGVPVSYAEINTVSALCEIVAMRDDLVPDVSLGTHFFSDLVEENILYLALFPGRDGHFLNESFLEGCRNRLADLLPDAAGRADVIHVIDGSDLPPGTAIKLYANALKQWVICYIER